MRESLGGAFLFNLVLVFLGIYISVLAFGIIYAKAFNSKNHIITMIEQNEGINDKQIEDYLKDRNSASLAMGIDFSTCCEYARKNFKTTIGNSNDCNNNNTKAINGACIFTQTVGANSTVGGVEAKMYTVVTYMDINIPAIRLVMKAFPIAGETSVIYAREKTTNNNG